MKTKIKFVSMTLKVAIFGVAVWAFTGCDTDKISYNEIFEHTSHSYEDSCNTTKRGGSWMGGHYFSNSRYQDGEFISPSELNRQEKGLIGACTYKEKIVKWDEQVTKLRDSYYYKYGLDGIKKADKEIKERFKKSCYASEEPREEYRTGFKKIDKDGSLLIDNKYRVLTIVESAEYKEEKDESYCIKREIYKLVKKEE